MSTTEMTENMKFFTKSEIRLKILSELDENPLSIKELVKKTKITYSSVSSNISKLEKSDHIEKINNKYHLNPLSKVYFKILMEFKNSVDLIDEMNDLWHQHNINQLSIESIENITDLKDSELIETTPTDIYRTHNITKNHILESNNLKAVFPFLHPEYPQLIETVLKNGGDVELILPKCIIKETVFSINDSIRRKSTRNGKFKVYVADDNLKLYLAVGDENMSLGLFKNDGSFDQNRILISENEKSLNWAKSLFEHVKNVA